MLGRNIARTVRVLYILVIAFLFIGVFMWPLLLLAEIIRYYKLRCPVCEKRVVLSWSNKSLSYCNKCGSQVRYNDDL